MKDSTKDDTNTETAAEASPRVGDPVFALLWACQAVLFLVFILAGPAQIFTSIETLSVYAGWVTAFPVWAIRAVGVLEALGAIGVFFPSLLRIKPGLSILAAIGLMMAMFVAASLHYMRGEYISMALPVLLAVISAYVALMRLTKAQVRGR